MLPSRDEQVKRLLQLDSATQARILTSLLGAVPGLEPALQISLEALQKSPSENLCSTPASTSSADTVELSRTNNSAGSPDRRAALPSRIPKSPLREGDQRQKYRQPERAPNQHEPSLSDPTVAYFWTLLLSFRKALQKSRPGTDMVWTKTRPQSPGEAQIICQLCSQQKFLTGTGVPWMPSSLEQ
ncbi:hypothetical protein WJX84_012425 [Apatococcus fuscideae]|uniref:Uncharacterized protein n=1 Tax=Apatococcus fuscideae TaxID=2026836 RepID=A0AAW1SN65_9CHLO